MFEFLLWAAILIAAAGALYAYSASRDVFHPLMFLTPLVMFLYGWMPMKLASNGGLDGFFQKDQLVFVQSWVVAGVASLVIGCLTPGCRYMPETVWSRLDNHAAKILVRGAVITGGLGLACWVASILNVGGLREAFSRPYSGGWDDSGYVRDGALLLFPGFLMIMAVILRWRPRMLYVLTAALCIMPWMIQAALTSRRGPTFMIAVVNIMGWYIHRSKRPPILLAVGGGVLVGLLMLFLVSNRGAIYLGSDQDLTTEVTQIVEKPDTGNEYIYGAGSVLSSEQRQRFFWGLRYLAQVLVRPIPSAIWPTKYEDFGVPELTQNAGTGEGLSETLGWAGADGAAPGIVADLWLEFRWLSIPALWVIGLIYGTAWQNMRRKGGAWSIYYVVLAALSVYLVMQTMEAIIFRLLLMTVPVWLTWRFASRPQLVV